MTAVPRFHLALPVRDLDETRGFYGRLLECTLLEYNWGRSSGEWVDFDFFGHRIVTHLSAASGGAEEHNSVDGAKIPVRRFGIVLDMEKWRNLAAGPKGAGAKFLAGPGIRLAGGRRGPAVFFVADPGGNAPEFKAFARGEQNFAR
jgi:extradiol dioxygenase family protein